MKTVYNWFSIAMVPLLQSFPGTFSRHNASRPAKVLLALSLLIFTFSVSGRAQVTGASVSGMVGDPSKAVIAGAQVEMTSQGRGASHQATTNADGFYSIANVDPGDYSVTVSARGFAVDATSITVTVGQQATANFQLSVGSQSERIEVKSDIGGIELASSSLSNVVSGQTVRDLPLNGRDWTQLATLEPGVDTVGTQKQIQTGANARVNGGFGLQMTISGARPQQTNYRLDGVSLNDYSSSGPGNALGGSSGVDSIQEFSVITSNAEADYGKTSGGVVNAVSRSGANRFHGNAYEYIRNSALDARNYFDPVAEPPFRRNQFGGSVGGRIVKDRTFFFANYEGTRQGLSSTTTNVVPSAAAHTGQLAAGKVTIDPKILPYLALFPLPNGLTAGDTGVFSYVGKTITNENFFTLRGDQTFSPQDTLTMTYQRDISSVAGPDSFGYSTSALAARRHVATVAETHIFRPTLINTARVGFNRVIGQGPVPTTALDPRAADTSLGFVPNQPVGAIVVTGLSTFSGGLGAQAQSVFHFNSYQIYDDLFLSLGTHSFKFGVSLERDNTNEAQSNQPIGSYSFGTLAGFLTNTATQFSTAIPGFQPELGLNQDIIGAYAQDNWHIRSNLTFNIGLRYEMSTVPTEEHNRLSTLANLTDPTPKLGSPFYMNPTKLNFAPRIGLAWDPYGTGKTSVRAAYGIYDTLPMVYMITGFVTGVAPYAQLGTLSNPPKGTFPNGGLALLNSSSVRVAYVQQNPRRSYIQQYSFSVQQEFPASIVLLIGYTGSRGIRQPFRSNDADIVLPTQTPLGLVWPTVRGSGTKLNPNVGRIEALTWITPTSYNALNLRLTKALSNGVQFGSSYTWSRSIDTGSGSIAGGAFDNSIVGLPILYPKLVRGLSDYDIRHLFVINALWNIQVPKNLGLMERLASGWQIGGIYRATSGQPFTPVIGGDPLGMNNSSPFDYPDRQRIGGCESLINRGNPKQYIRTQCFTVPVLPTLLGNAGRNIVLGPGVSALDASLIKNTSFPRISEAFHVQFRAEAFNVLNHSNFQAPTPPGTQIFNQSFQRLPSAGVLTRTSTTNRQLQFALKLIY